MLANQRCRDLYPALADHIRPEVSFAELARRLARSGWVPEAMGREGAWVSERVAHSRLPDSEPLERQLADARWLRVSDRRTAEGGLVTLHSDGPTVRESDTLARFGGDEFTLVRSRLHEPRSAGVLAAKILAAVARPLRDRRSGAADHDEQRNRGLSGARD